MTPRAPRNKTLTLSPAEQQFYAQKSLVLQEPTSLAAITDQVILGDAFQMLSYLPNQFVDLLVVDPPYNLYKNYHGHGFRQTSQDAYAAYTRQWVEKVLPLLKPTASLYVCCDSRLFLGAKPYFLATGKRPRC